MAGLKLWGRKPISAPMSARHSTNRWLSSGPSSATAMPRAMIRIPPALKTVVPLSNPSSPSIRFAALHKATTDSPMMAVPAQYTMSMGMPVPGITKPTVSII